MPRHADGEGGRGEPTEHGVLEGPSTSKPWPEPTFMHRAWPRVLRGLKERQERRGWQTSQALFQLALAGLGLLALARAVPATLVGFYRHIGAYDEGVLLTGAHLVLRGEVPYRDFYSNYPPGIFLLLAGLFKLFGVSVAVERTLGFVLHLIIAALAGRIAGRQLGQPVSLVIVGLVATWLVILGVPSYAWLTGLALALLACELWTWAYARGRASGYVLTGAALGVLSWFRHDLFIYFSLALGGAGAVWAGLALRRGDRAPLMSALWTALGAVLVASLLWVPVFALAGFRQVAADLYLDQVRHTMPARVLPLPSLFALAPPVGFPYPLPLFLRQPFAAAVMLTFLGPVLAIAAILLPRFSGLRERTTMLWPAALSLAVLPQMLGRTDIYHAVFAVTPALIAAAVWLLGGPARPWRPLLACALVALGAVLAFLPIRVKTAVAVADAPAETPAALSRAGRTPVDAAHQRIVSFVQKYTGPDDPIYVGLTDHRHTYDNDMSVYFLADRVGATRYMQFDPGLANREDVQRAMIAELEQRQPKVAILGSPNKREEQNDSRTEGSRVLDRYLRSHYETKRQAGKFMLMLRKPATPKGAPAQ
jgi:hypothetical protein